MSKTRQIEDQKFQRLVRKLTTKRRDNERTSSRRAKRLIQSYLTKTPR